MTMIFPIVGPINQSWEDHRESPVQGAAGLVLPGLSNKHNWGPTQYRKTAGIDGSLFHLFHLFPVKIDGHLLTQYDGYF